MFTGRLDDFEDFFDFVASSETLDYLDIKKQFPCNNQPYKICQNYAGPP